MSFRNRLMIILLAIIVLIVIVLGVDTWRRRQATDQTGNIPPGSIPIYVNGELGGHFSPEDLEQLEQVSFVDAEDGKTQEGWLLADVLALHFNTANLDRQAEITVSSSSRGKSAQVTWEQVQDTDNMVMFDLSGRGTLKLVSKLEILDTRDEWVQDTDKIEIETP